jgi:cyclopropane-fatty-acyl-phospholipid synthase
MTPTTSSPDLLRWPSLAPPPRSFIRATLARLLMHRVASHSGIRVQLPGGHSFGPSGGPLILIFNPKSFFARLGRNGKIGFGEAYMVGDWDSPEIENVIEALANNVTTLVPPGTRWLRRFYDAHHPATEANDHKGARRNISHHYDMSNDLFANFLDQSMTYSSALFDNPDEPLEHAQTRKIDHILDVADVHDGTKVLEIGTGWGALALRAARRGAHVTSVTLSEEQATFARRQAQDAGLASLIDIKVQDYRDIVGNFDAIVSVEMIEAVGAEWLPTYFRQLDALLAPNGKVGIQSILMDHSQVMVTRFSWTWIHKYIFPGGLIPSRRIIDEILARDTTLRVSQEVAFGESYAITLDRWRQNFKAHTHQIAELGFDETFRRMWTFYLAYCEAGFRSGYLNVQQLRLDRDDAPQLVG